jgi:hypothetical protein
MSPAIRIGAAVVIVGVVAAVVLRAGCDDPDEIAIAALLDQLVEAAQAGDRDAFEEGLSLDYSDPYGMDRESVTDRVLRTAERIELTAIQLSKVDIEVDEERRAARVRFKVDLEGDKAGRDPEAEELRERRRVVLEVVERNGRWVVRRGEIVYTLF